MKKVQLNNTISWIGKVDNRKVPFHRLILERGTTYNSYLLETDKPTVIDTVDILYSKEYVENISKVIEPERIAYIIINHVEPDHAGALPALAAKAKNAIIVSTALGAQLLKDMFKLHEREFLIVKDGDSLDIGGKTLRFFETPYLHTEETMITYCEEDEILFTCDIFSTHIANEELFNDLAKEEYIADFEVYYQLIMSPHRPYVREMLAKIKNLSIQLIAPSHGYILRDQVALFIGKYDKMSSIGGEEIKKVAIVYSTMTGNTTKVAQRLARGLEESGIAASVFNLRNADLQEVKQKVLASDGVLVGSATKYGDMVGNVEEFLKQLEKEQVEGQYAAAFGSFGWSGEAVTHVEDYLQRIGFRVVNQSYLNKVTGVDTLAFPLRVQFAKEEGLKKATESGKTFAEVVLSK
jgi:flavorubredoxin